MSIVSKPHSVYLPPTSPSHIVCLTCCACPSDVILRGSVGLSPDSLCYNVPPPLCFPFSPPLSLSLCGLVYFISLVSRMRMNPLSLPHILPVQKASSECNRPSHRLLKTPQSLSVPLDIQIRYTMLYLNPSFRDFNSSRSPFQSVHIFTNILSFQTVPCRRARTDTHTSRKSCAPSRIHSFKMTLLFLKSVSIPHSPATIVDPTSFSTLEGLCVTYVQSVLNYRTHYMYHYCLVCVCGSTR